MAKRVSLNENCQTHNLHALFISLIELVSEPIQLELLTSSGISTTASLWTHFEIFGSSVLRSSDCTEHPLPALGKHLCARNGLLAGTITDGRGIQSEQKLDLDWMTSWKETGLSKDPRAETGSSRGGKKKE